MVRTGVRRVFGDEPWRQRHRFPSAWEQVHLTGNGGVGRRYSMCDRASYSAKQVELRLERRPVVRHFGRYPNVGTPERDGPGRESAEQPVELVRVGGGWRRTAVSDAVVPLGMRQANSRVNSSPASATVRSCMHTVSQVPMLGRASCAAVTPVMGVGEVVASPSTAANRNTASSATRPALRPPARQWLTQSFCSARGSPTALRVKGGDQHPL